MQANARTATIFIVVASAAVFLLVLFRALGYLPQSAITPLVAEGGEVRTAIATSSMPARLRIPSVGIDAKVQRVGVNAAGDMGVPSNFSDVAWYKDGVAPGQVGSAVIDGHVDNGLGLAGVFKRLGTLKAGDDIFIRTAGGTDLHFIVFDRETYPYREVPMEKVFAEAQAARLSLITCGGKWVPGSRTYDRRIVVYATLVGS